jgi:ABC-2 type transport system permease protein
VSAATATLRTNGWRQNLRVIWVIAGSEFRLKYSGSALGYVWSVVKPLGLFTTLYLVFGRVFKLGTVIPHYPVYLLLGLVLWTYFVDTTSLAMSSLVTRSSLISKLAFPRAIVPISVSTTTALTLLVNFGVVGIFVIGSGIEPRLSWLLLIPLLVELFVVALGVSLFLSAAFVQLRDIGQVWELAVQLMFYASPIIYPAGYLPPWWRPVAYLSPMVQIIQNARYALLPNAAIVTPADVYHSPFGELIPLAVGAVIVIGGYVFFRKKSPWFAERT